MKDSRVAVAVTNAGHKNIVKLASVHAKVLHVLEEITVPSPFWCETAHIVFERVGEGDALSVIGLERCAVPVEVEVGAEPQVTKGRLVRPSPSYQDRSARKVFRNTVELTSSCGSGDPTTRGTVPTTRTRSDLICMILRF